MKSIYAKPHLFLLLVFMTVPLAAKLGRPLLFDAKDKEMAATLLDAGADINAQDEDGTTFLAYQVDLLPYKRKEDPVNPRIRMELIKYLLQNGADPTIKNKQGYSAFSLELIRKFQPS